jgi:hypothetical protein
MPFVVEMNRQENASELLQVEENNDAVPGAPHGRPRQPRYLG